MKLKLIIPVLLVVLYSCGKDDENGLSEADTEKLKKEVKEVVNSIYKGCEEVNSGQVTAACIKSADFTYLFNGTTLDYTEFAGKLKAVFDKMVSQNIILQKEKFTIVDNSTVLFTTNLTFNQKFKDGTAILIDTAAMLFIFRKIQGKWMWIYGVESYGM